MASVDSSKYQPLGGSSRRYIVRETGEVISRREAMKRSSSQQVSLATALGGFRERVLRKAWDKEYGRGEEKELYNEMVEGLNKQHPLNEQVRKGVDYTGWVRVIEDYSIDEHIDWSEFFRDSPGGRK